MKRHLLTIFLLIAPFCTIFSNEQFIFKQISQKEGLTATVNSIYKEYDGDVWIGSPNGLYRFNGSTLYHYEDSLFNGLTVFNTDVDRNGNFWILTNRKLICRKSGEDEFKALMIDKELPQGPFHSICQDGDNVWFGSKGCIYRYSLAEDRLSLFSEMKEFPDFICRNMSMIEDGTILCGSHNGMLLLDTTTGIISEAPFGTRSEVTATLVDSEGRIWIAFYNNGIEVYDKTGNLLKKYNTENSDLSNNVVLCMTERESIIWAGTDGGGVNIINPKEDRIKTLSLISGDPSSFPAHSIKSIYTDHHGNIWTGSVRDGLIRISSSKMKTYVDVHLCMDTGLSNPTVTSIHQDKVEGLIWLGTDGEGVNSFDPVTHRFRHFPFSFKKKIVSVADYSDKELALTAYDDRIWIFNKHTGHMRPMPIKDDVMIYQMKYAGRTINLFNEKDGTLLLIGNRVKRYDKVTAKCTTIRNSVQEKAHGNYFPISHTDNGIWFHDFHNIYFMPDKGDMLEMRGTLNNITLKSGHIGRDGIIWLATSEGLYSYDTSDSTFTHIKTSLFSNAASVVCDNHNRVWVGTDDHLYVYLTYSETFTLFGESDGAAMNEYLSKPHLLSDNGDVYLGGVRGLLCIDGTFSIHTDEIPSVSLYSLTVDNATIKVTDGGSCRLPRNSNTVEIKVSVQETDIFRDKMYRFEIGNTIIVETDSPVFTIRQLPSPGTYDVHVSCNRRNGEWTEPVKVFSMTVPKPWYGTWWFILSVAAFILLMTSAVFYTIVQRKSSMARMAMKEQEQKMSEEKVRMLINISHELRTPLTLIMAPLKRLISEGRFQESESGTLNRIYRQSRRMRDLLNMVLDLRKMEVGKTSLKMEKVDFNGWVTGIISDIIDEEKEVGISIVTELDPELSDIHMDTHMCDTVITNILMNAIKHSKTGDKITIRTEVTEEDMARVTISDQGPGLKDVDESRLFTRFYQSNSEQYGSGIGLSFSKILVELQGGHIGAYNNEDRGASFWWELHVEPVDGTVINVPAKAYLNEIVGNDIADNDKTPHKTIFDTTGMSLMLVDDSQDLLEFMKEALCQDFKEIMTATSGNEALKALNSGRLPDIIVSDVNMPDGNGFKMCSEIKEDENLNHIPVILLTARGEEHSQSESYRAGADAFIAKPFEVETLLEMIRGILKRKAEIRKKYLDNDTDAGYTSTEESLIVKLNKVIGEHIDDPELDQQIICKELGMSRASLYSKMKAITGIGVKEYITKIRIEKAKMLIETSDRSITEISEMTGFSASSYFSTAFKNYTGMTPSQYKKQIKS